MRQLPSVDAIDHVVLTVSDVAASRKFYARVLQMRAKIFEGNKTALHFGPQKINLHQAGKEFEPKALRPAPGSADICFVTRDSLRAWQVRLNRLRVRALEGPVQQIGSQGPMNSIYFRDPDGNLIEVAQYRSSRADGRR